MNEQEIRKTLKKKIKDITNLCRDIGKDLDKEAIHNFRTTVKALRSFIRLLRMYTHNPSPKIPEKFMRLYHIAGIIRDAQIEIEMLSHKQLEMPLYFNKLHKTLDGQKKIWDKSYSKKTLRKLGEKLTDIKYKPLEPETLAQFFIDRRAYINVAKQATPPTDRRIHDMRKKIKDILYTAKIVGKGKYQPYKNVNPIQLKKMDKLADMIGDYNDRRQMMEHLTAFSIQITAQNEKGVIEKFRKKEIQALTVRKKRMLIAATHLAFEKA